MTDDAEQEIVECITLNRFNLNRFIGDFTLSVNLFELLERGGGPPSAGVLGGVFSQYRMIVARDGALNIYHFKCSLEAIRSLLPTAPNLARTVDALQLREAAKQFRSYFPHTDLVRNAVAHAGELYDKPWKIKRNTLRKDSNFHGGFVMAGALGVASIYERTYSVSIDGEVFSIELTNESIRKLAHVSALADRAFQGRSAGVEPSRES